MPAGNMSAPATFGQAGIDALSRWRFHPRMVGGKPVATDNLMQMMLFSLSSAGKTDQTHMAQVGATLNWLCRLPLMHGMKIAGSGATGPAAPSTFPAPDRGYVPEPAYDAVVLPAGILPAGKAAAGHARIHFCVDAEGRLADTEVEASGPSPLYGRAARRVLEQVHLFPRRVDGKPVTTCGLSVHVAFAGSPASDGVIGRIDEMRRAGQTSVPAFKSARPVKLALHIPAGTRLPPVAKVEVRFCIDKDGSVSEPEVARAMPARYFDQAAIKTVRGWRFASPPRRICDVYQWVKFPLSGGGS